MPPAPARCSIRKRSATVSPGSTGARAYHREMDDLAPPVSEEGFAGRYEDRGRLGIGGMGDVRLCEDRLIGREIALKVALCDRVVPDAGVRERFLREARLQARLEHPSIVPVYDMGTARSGSAWFTMKRVRGLTLRRVLKAI